MAITLRAAKGSALTHSELDANFTDLDTRTTAIETGAYATIYSSQNDAVTVSTIGTTAKKLVGFSNNGPSNNLTPDSANDRMVILAKGDYWVDVSVSFGTVAPGDSGLYEFHVRVNDVETVVEFHRNMSGTSDKGSSGCSGILSMDVGDVVTLWVESDEAGDTDDISISNVALNALMVRAT